MFMLTPVIIVINIYKAHSPSNQCSACVHSAFYSLLVAKVCYNNSLKGADS